MVDGPEKGSRRFGISIHDASHGENRERLPANKVEAHWRLDFWIGTSTVKTDLIAKSDRVGGYHGVLPRIAEHWPTKRPLVIGASAYYQLRTDRYRVCDQVRAAPAPLTLGDLKLKPDALVWRVVDQNRTNYVTIPHTSPPKKDTEVITWSGELTCRFSSTFLSDVDGLIWEAIRPILVEGT